MSSNTIGSIIGAGIGFLVGGPTGARWGFMIGGALAGIVDPQKIKGPRLTDATRQTSMEGIPIPWGYGTFPTAGNIIFAGPLVEHKHEEGGKGGPVTVSYTYTRSYAIGICEGPISGIQKIKRNGKLVYDISPTSTLSAESAKFLEKCTIYLGDETQNVDPTIEAIKGVGATGPYRGLAYIVLEDDDLTESQGAIAQYEFVVQMCGDVVTTPPDYILALGPAFYYKLTEGGSTGPDSIGNLPDLNFGGSYDSGATGLSFLALDGYAEVATGMDALDGATSLSIFVKFRLDDVSETPDVYRLIAGHYTNTVFGFNDWSFILRGPNKLTPQAEFNNGSGSGQVLEAGFEVAVGQEYVAGIVRNGGTVSFLINGEVVDTASTSGSFGGTSALMLGGYEYPSSYGGQLTVSHLAGVARAVTTEEAALIPYYLNVLPEGAYAIPDMPGLYVDPDGNVVSTVGGSTIDTCAAILGDIVTDLCRRAGIDVATEIDVSELTDVVDGFKCATESGADAFIESLTLSHFFDRAEWDKKLRFPKRGGAILAALTMDDVVSRDGPVIEQTRIQEPELLRKVNVLSIDPAADYNMTKQSWERRAGTIKAVGEASVELPEVIATDTAAQIAEIRGKIAWAETDKFKFGYSVKWSKLTPTDPITLTDRAGLIHRIRLQDVREELGRFDIEEAIKDRASVYGSTATGETNPNVPGPTSPGLVGPTLFVAMNLPQMRSQDGAGLYVGMTGILPGWQGAQLFLSVDGGLSYSPVLSVTTPTTMGPLTADIDAIGSASEPLSVHVYGGQLSSATTAQVASGINYSAVQTETSAGMIAEVLAYEDATETATGFYDLSTLTRGIKDTSVADHYTGDMFMDLATSRFLAIDQSLAGSTLYFKAVGFGVSIDAVPAVAVVYEGLTVIHDGGEIT